MNLAKIIDETGKAFSRIKTIAVLALLILLGVSAINNGCNKSQLEKMVEKVTGLNVRNDIMQEDIKKKDALIKAREDSIAVLHLAIWDSRDREAILENKYSVVKGKYDKIASDLLKIPAEESYAFLDTSAYPYGGRKEFPFSAPQVKGMHQTYLENKSLIELNANLLDQKGELVQQIKLRGAVEEQLSLSMKAQVDTRSDLEHIIANQDSVIQIQEKNAKKQKRKSFWAKVGIGVGALLIGFLAGS